MNIEIYTKQDCPFCVEAKKLLKKSSKPFKEYKIGKDISRDDLKLKYPEARLAPVVIIDGKYIGGFDDLSDLIA